MSLRNPERGLLSVKGLIFTLGLIASFIFVGAIYGILIRPGANKADLANSFGIDVGSSFSSFFVILKDYEQQMCLSLFLWGVMILIYKFILLKNEAKTPPKSNKTTTPCLIDCGRILPPKMEGKSIQNP